MNIWLSGAFALLLGLLPLARVVWRAPLAQALVAVQLASSLFALVMLLLAQGYGQTSFADLALAVAILSFPAGLLFAHFFERWL